MSVHDQLMDPLTVHKVGDKKSRERRVLDHRDGGPAELARRPAGPVRRPAPARGHRPRPSLEPDAIIADEPTSALDAGVGAQI